MLPRLHPMVKQMIFRKLQERFIMADESNNQGGQQTQTVTPQTAVQQPAPVAIPVHVETSSEVYFFKGNDSLPLTTKETK